MRFNGRLQGWMGADQRQGFWEKCVGVSAQGAISIEASVYQRLCLMQTGKINHRLTTLTALAASAQYGRVGQAARRAALACRFDGAFGPLSLI